MRKLLLLNGPNLNLLGSREPAVYGSATLAQIEADLTSQAIALGLELQCFQSNHEGVLVDRIHQEVVKAVAAPDVQKRFADLGVEARAMTPAQMKQFFGGEVQRWARVVEAANIPKQ